MTLNQRIIQVLSPLGLPVVPDVDTLHRPRCLVFNYDLLPAQPADNRPTWYKALIQVHLYLPLGNEGTPEAGDGGVGGCRHDVARDHRRHRR